MSRKRNQNLFERNTTVRRLSHLALAAVFLKSGSFAVGEIMQAVENRPAVVAHREMVNEATDAFDNSVFDFVNHMSQEQFDQFTHALAMANSMAPEDFIAARHEPWLDSVMMSDQMVIRRATGSMVTSGQNPTTRSTNLLRFMDGDLNRIGANNRTSTIEGFTSAVGDIINGATIGEPETDMMGFISDRMGDLQHANAQSPDVERHARGWATAGTIGLALGTIIPSVKLTKISIVEGKNRKERRAKEREVKKEARALKTKEEKAAKALLVKQAADAAAKEEAKKLDERRKKEMKDITGSFATFAQTGDPAHRENLEALAKKMLETDGDDYGLMNLLKEQDRKRLDAKRASISTDNKLNVDVMRNIAQGIVHVPEITGVAGRDLGSETQENWQGDKEKED
ncbi:MAG: hypothetical protein FWE31_00150 [Firmicutes bacterium]|nr:hypothetical protein [Bacillota bacterium]